jgi:chromosome segregation DNA-binding protein
MGKALGKGLDALLSSLEVDEQEKVEEIPLKEIRPNPYQPRRIFDEKAIEELKQSIIEHGVLQPIILRKTIRGYEIVVGERRFRAAKAANLEKIPAVVRNINEQEMMELALLENLQREDLTPIEEGRAYQMIMDRLNITQEELSKRIGKSRPHIANHVRLLSLPPQIQQMINENQLSMGHGRALLGLKQKEK